jgi:phosphatidylethanolamine/phosphatidyl-N-methylethanolamine N-methyltransferase
VIGIDFSGEMLEEARHRVRRHSMRHVELRQMDAAKMDFPDASFDAVIAAYVVTAVPDYRAVLKEIVRVCRPGGRVILLNHFTNGNSVIGMLARAFSPVFKYAGFRTDLTISDVVDDAGLSVMAVQRLNPFGLWRLVACINNGNE